MKVYVINAPKRPDRKALFEKNPLDDYTFTTNWPYNINGEDITDEWLDKNNFKLYDWKMKDDDGYSKTIEGNETFLVWWQRDLTKGEIGCSLSHWSVWKECSENTEGVIILEDDAYFKNDMLIKVYNTIDKLKHINYDWDLLYLGRVPQDIDYEEGGPLPNLNQNLQYSYCLYGYCLSKTGIDKILNYNFEKKIIPADEFLSAAHCKHYRYDIRRDFPPTLKALAFNPRIVQQRSFDLVGSDTGLPDSKVKW